jgi:hypothetical protein
VMLKVLVLVLCRLDIICARCVVSSSFPVRIQYTN